MIPASPRRRKVRLLREAPAADTTVVLRATRSTVDETIDDLVDVAILSSETYVVAIGGRQELLYGISVFATDADSDTLAILERFDTAESYLTVSVGRLRANGFEVFATGARSDHFDVQLAGGCTTESEPLSRADLAAAARRLVEIAGPLRRNPLYHEPQEDR